MFDGLPCQVPGTPLPVEQDYVIGVLFNAAAFRIGSGWSPGAIVLNKHTPLLTINPLNPELNPICYLLALLAHHFLHVSRIRVKSLTIRLLMLYIYIYMEHLFLMFLYHTQRRTTVGRTPLDE